MAVVCAICGKLSQDPEFCDYCNSDLLPRVGQLPPAVCPVSETGLALSAEERTTLTRAEAFVTVTGAHGAWRAHWIADALAPLWQARLERRLAVAASCLAPLERRADRGGSWLLVPAGAPWSPWLAPPSADPVAVLADLLHRVRPLAVALEALHEHGCVCLPFDPRALEQAPGSTDAPTLRFTNLDLELFAAGALPETLGVHHNYAAPEVYAFRPHDVGPRTDVFHLALFCYYWLARLLPDGFPGAGLEAFGYNFPFLRVYAPALLEGVSAVLRRGLALDPAQRPATPGDLVAALDEAHAGAVERRQHTRPLALDIGSHSRTGRAKTALRGSNEDQTLVRPYPESDAVLIAVADGVSTCHVGSGGLASLLTMVVLESGFAFGSSHEQFSAQAIQVCQRGAQSLLDWALEKGYRSQLQRGADLMGTTLTFGWLQGGRLSLANLGDSRAYLITADDIDQLTVDGDLASALLARRLPPEEVGEMGPVSRALRECVGGCIVTPEKEVKILLECCRPSLSHWSLVPGDVLVLCTDGLVEEGIFLDAPALADYVREHRALSAAELAERLCDLADQLQRVPTSHEPEGLGDNVSCVVVKIDSP